MGSDRAATTGQMRSSHDYLKLQAETAFPTFAAEEIEAIERSRYGQCVSKMISEVPFQVAGGPGRARGDGF